MKLSSRNMASKFVAPVIALALVVIASSFGKPLGEKSLLSRGKNHVSLCLQKKNRRPGRSNGLRSGPCALIFPLYHCRVPVLSYARCQTFDQTINNVLIGDYRPKRSRKEWRNIHRQKTANSWPWQWWTKKSGTCCPEKAELWIWLSSGFRNPCYKEYRPWPNWRANWWKTSMMAKRQTLGMC